MTYMYPSRRIFSVFFIRARQKFLQEKGIGHYLKSIFPQGATKTTRPLSSPSPKGPPDIPSEKGRNGHCTANLKIVQIALCCCRKNVWKGKEFDLTTGFGEEWPC